MQIVAIFGFWAVIYLLDTLNGEKPLHDFDRPWFWVISFLIVIALELEQIRKLLSPPKPAPKPDPNSLESIVSEHPHPDYRAIGIVLAVFLGLVALGVIAGMLFPPK